mmetsp:Transcript_21735/g.55139  ORF Transcript_21735/g.55139 Transcript_21735/m.55139 type:complete len:242 (-) Transcript_21735:5-730(-)
MSMPTQLAASKPRNGTRLQTSCPLKMETTSRMLKSSMTDSTDEPSLGRKENIARRRSIWKKYGGILPVLTFTTFTAMPATHSLAKSFKSFCNLAFSLSLSVDGMSELCETSDLAVQPSATLAPEPSAAARSPPLSCCWAAYGEASSSPRSDCSTMRGKPGRCCAMASPEGAFAATMSSMMEVGSARVTPQRLCKPDIISHLSSDSHAPPSCTASFQPQRNLSRNVSIATAPRPARGCCPGH